LRSFRQPAAPTLAHCTPHAKRNSAEQQIRQNLKAPAANPCATFCWRALRDAPRAVWKFVAAMFVASACGLSRLAGVN
jgi:hypothetical protein